MKVQHIPVAALPPILIDMRFSYFAPNGSSDSADFILGGTNFFNEFEVHFYRFDLAFEIYPKSNRR